MQKLRFKLLQVVHHLGVGVSQLPPHVTFERVQTARRTLDIGMVTHSINPRTWENKYGITTS